MQFEWDEAKSEACFRNRGFDFAYAAFAFADPDRMVRQDSRYSYGEDRYQLIGRIEGRLFVLVYTPRNDVMRIARIAQEHGLVPIVKEAGDAYARLGDVLATKCPLIVPLALPEAYDVEDPFAALEVSLAKLKHWELAPTNAARIAEAGGSFCFTGNGLTCTDINECSTNNGGCRFVRPASSTSRSW